MSIENKQELNVGLNGVVGFKPIVIKQYDKNTRRIEITLLEGSDIYEIPTGSVAKFQATKPDGTIIFDDCVIENGMVVYKAIEDLSTCAGAVKCEVGLYNSVGDELLQSSTFNIVVEESAMDRNAVASSNEFNTLTIMINTITGLVDRAEITLGEIDTAISNAETATSNANQSATNAQQATATINTTNQTITDSENIRIVSENTRKSNEITRQSQETTRQTNSTTAVTKADAATTRANLAAKSCEDIASGIIQLPDIGTANTYTKVTTDTKGRVISGSTPTAIADLGITNVYTKTEIDTKTNDINTSLGNQIATVTGSYLNLVNTHNGGLLLKELQGKTVVNGAPSAENPSTSTNVGDSGSVVLGTCGKNSLDFDAWKKVALTKCTAVWDSTNKSVTLTATGDDAYTEYNALSSTSLRIPVEPNKTYTLSWEYVGAAGNVFIFYNGLSSDSNAVGNVSKKITFTAKADTYFVTFRVGVAKSGNSCTYSKLQLEEGSSVTTYEQYKGQQVTIPTTQPWRSVNGYYDRPIKKDGLWGVERNVPQVVFDGSVDETVTFAAAQTNTNTVLFQLGMIRPWTSGGNRVVVSNRLITATTDNLWTTTYDTESLALGGMARTYVDVRLNKSRLATLDVAGVRAWLAANPITVRYAQETPTYEVLPQPLQDALNKLQSYPGVTNMFTTDPQQPIISVSYGKTDSSALALYAENVSDSKVDKSKSANNGLITEEGFYLDARYGKTLKDGLDVVNNNLGLYTKMQPTPRSSSDANLFNETFSMGFDIVNSPYTGQSANACVFISIPYDQATIALSTYAAQICIPVQVASRTPKYRQKTDGVWSPWKDF